ncbi:hypothetical protein X759_19300 [Mesorhizobium sp. LSHC420B00]|nr:hypothetical protein X759_19300 [Mesorhizobium sp. LSHC420B00]
MSLIKLSAATLTPASAEATKLPASAASISFERKRPLSPAPVEGLVFLLR